MSWTEAATKVALSAPLLLLLLLVWRSRIDAARLARAGWAGRSVVWASAREPDAVYQEGTVVGRVEGVEISEPERLVTFRAIHQTGPLDVGAPFDFRRYRLKPRAIESLGTLEAAFPDRGRILEGVTCEIVPLG